jgi:outer membrane protein OmpA-like peptidoglycan-associated protein
MMNIWNKLKDASTVLSVAVVLAMAGCAQHQIASESTSASAQNTMKEESKSEKAPLASMAPGEEIVPDYAVMNPVPIAFDKMSVKLRDIDKQILAQIKDRAQKARKLTITGYCDRTQVGNAKAAALARAQSVKDELVRLGIKSKVVKVKFVTNVANKHAVEVEL